MEYLHWLERFDHDLRIQLTNYINHKIINIINNNYKRFFNKNNSISDIVDLIYDKLIIEIAPDSNSSDKEIANYVTLTEDIDELKDYIDYYLRELYDNN